MFISNLTDLPLSSLFLHIICVTLEDSRCTGSVCPITSVGQDSRTGGEEIQNIRVEGKGGRKIATHNALPGRPCCCWGRRRRRRKGVRAAGAVSLVTEGGEIMK